MNDLHARYQAALQRYERPLIRYALGILPQLEDAQDVVQDTFLTLHRHLATLDADRLAPWLFTVCKNRALDHRRKNHRLIPMETATLELEATPEPAPDVQLDQRETAATLRRLIDQLPDRQREAVRLKFLAGLDYKQIAETMQTSIGNVGYLIHHGIATLRQHWEAQEITATH